MPTPRQHPKDYEMRHYSVLSHAYHEGEIPLIFLNEASARSHRGLLYAVRQSVLSNPDWNPEMTKIVKELIFRIEDKTLIVQRKQQHDPQSDVPDLS